MTFDEYKQHIFRIYFTETQSEIIKCHFRFITYYWRVETTASVFCLLSCQWAGTHANSPKAVEDEEKLRGSEREEFKVAVVLLCVCEIVSGGGFVWVCVLLCLRIWAASHTASQQLDRERQQRGTWTSDQKQSPGRLCISAFPPLIHSTPTPPLPL